MTSLSLPFEVIGTSKPARVLKRHHVHEWKLPGDPQLVSAVPPGAGNPRRSADDGETVRGCDGVLLGVSGVIP